ncbi:conserved Plasmodium protein, unknown function [Plasmodium vinckei]|uniref:Uncharacterized protein n=1 Tax=Plasmodium vinckei TaxID=5860 RepID=A0A6V7TCD7_PLAVN|nr:conserved Plasmodium protein, unknown function [Plasmodium vinckei]
MILKKKLLLIVNLFIVCVYLDFQSVESKINKINYNNDDLLNNLVDMPIPYSSGNDNNQNELSNADNASNENDIENANNASNENNIENANEINEINHIDDPSTISHLDSDIIYKSEENFENVNEPIETQEDTINEVQEHVEDAYQNEINTIEDAYQNEINNIENVYQNEINTIEEELNNEIENIEDAVYQNESENIEDAVYQNESENTEDAVHQNETENTDQNYDLFPSFKEPLDINKAFKKQMSMSRWNNIFNFFRTSKAQGFREAKNNFLNEIQNSYAYRNGLYFSVTSVGEYNKEVDSNQYATINLPDNTMVLVVTGNKLFLQDLIYSANKENAIKTKFTYTMNKIIKNLKKKLYFKNFKYQYLYRNDSFAEDSSNKLLDMNLLGELSNITQTIYTDDAKENKVSMHKIYGGWFHFLGIFVINGYDYQVVNNPKIEDALGEKSNDVVPHNLLPEFRNLLTKKNPGEYQNGYVLGLWRDFPNDKFINWRYSLELFLWDLLGVLPHELPHPSDLIVSYNKYEEYKELELAQQEEDDSDESTHLNNEHKDGLYHFDIENTWHKIIMNKILSYRGFDVTIVSAQDYMNASGYDNEIVSKYYNLKNEKEYIFLILLNKDFFVDEFVKSQNYNTSKQNYFDVILKDIVDDVIKILEEVKTKLFPDNDDIKPIVSVYNYLEEFESNSAKINPHILGEIAGITKHLKCENLFKSSSKCTKDISIHHKYGGWFEFGGAIYVKNVNHVDISYEHRNDKEPIIKKEYEQAILAQANSNYSSAGLWRDIPEKYMAPYRYPLEVFALENPELNILNLRDIHPFVAMEILNKGLNSMQSHEHVALHDSNQIMVTSFSSENTNSITAPVASIAPTVPTTHATPMTHTAPTTHTVPAAPLGVTSNTETQHDGFVINENINIHNNPDEDNEYEDPSSEHDDAIYIEIDHGVQATAKPAKVTKPKNENTKNIDLITNKNLFNANTSDIFTGNPFFSNNKHQSFIDNFNYITKSVSDNKPFTDDDDDDDDDEDEEEEEDDDPRLIINNNNNNKYFKNIRNSDKINSTLNTVASYINKYTNSENLSGSLFNDQVYITMTFCIVFLFVALFVLIVVRLCSLLTKRKTANGNRGISLSLREKTSIPVAQGLPAPWLNA